MNDYLEFVERVKARKALCDASAIDYSDAPDEFLDELMFELMDEPMKLPSGHHMDRSHLEKALLSNPVDPWTMTTLTIEQCVLDEELKRRIDEYKASKKAQK